MRNINLRYVDEEYGEDGILKHVSYHDPDNYNFGYDVVDEIAEHEPDRLAMIWTNPSGVEKRFTFGDMKRMSDKTANYLLSLGIKKGDMVMVILKRHYQFWYVIVALHKIGAVIVPATFMLTKGDVEYRVRSASIKAAICTDMNGVCDAVDSAEDVPTLQIKIVANSSRDGWLQLDEGIEKASDKLERIETEVHEPMLMYFSSGTSGSGSGAKYYAKLTGKLSMGAEIKAGWDAIASLSAGAEGTVVEASASVTVSNGSVSKDSGFSLRMGELEAYIQGCLFTAKIDIARFTIYKGWAFA